MCVHRSIVYKQGARVKENSDGVVEKNHVNFGDDGRGSCLHEQHRREQRSSAPGLPSRHQGGGSSGQLSALLDQRECRSDAAHDRAASPPRDHPHNKRPRSATAAATAPSPWSASDHGD